MAILRRSAAPPAAPAPAAPALGKKLMRRVELRGSPGEPYWYMETLSDHDAIATLARNFRPARNPQLFHVVDRYER